jgi:hypothetical protein
MPANSARHRVHTLPLAKVRLVHVLENIGAYLGCLHAPFYTFQANQLLSEILGSIYFYTGRASRQSHRVGNNFPADWESVS